MTREIAFDNLVREVLGCTACSRMACSKRVLNTGCGPLHAPIMVIGEAPGRLGADASELPFHGDRAGQNFEDLIKLAGLGRDELFITNAVLCNPKDQKGNNAAPLGSEITACSTFLKRQIDLLDPQFIVALGSVALRALASIESHTISLRDAVRTKVNWYGRTLFPLYHPGQRAMIHRSFANQAADYQFVSEVVRRSKSIRRGKNYARARADATLLADAVLSRVGTISYFALHKLCYLVELRCLEERGERATGAYYVRQKDGPYCVELHPTRLKKAGLEVSWNGGKHPRVAKLGGSLFEMSKVEGIGEDVAKVINEVAEKYGKLSDERLKTVVYLSSPMRRILRLEKSGLSQFNAPIFL